MFDPDSAKIRFEHSDDSDYVSDIRDAVRPIQGPKPTKDFKKVMSRTGRQGKEEEEDELLKKVSSDEEEAGEQQAAALGTKPKRGLLDDDDVDEGPVSLFDLSKRAAQRDREERQGARKSKSPIEAIEEVTTTQKEERREEIKTEREPEETPTPKFTTRYTQEQPDISSVNPLAAAAATIQPTIQTHLEAKVEKPVPVNQALQEICAQLVKQMYTVEKKGQTDTVVVLQYPPLFKDAKIVVSAFDTAKGQFNISFENLIQAAQLLLDKEENRQSLLLALEKRGYNVQILTTTTITDSAIPIIEEKAPPYSHRDPEDEKRDRQDRNKKQDQQE